jgi:hypothetical protein
MFELEISAVELGSCMLNLGFQGWEFRIQCRVSDFRSESQQGESTTGGANTGTAAALLGGTPGVRGSTTGDHGNIVGASDRPPGVHKVARREAARMHRGCAGSPGARVVETNLRLGGI